MTAYDEARAAGLAALHADSEWHYSDGTGVWRANYGRAVDLIIAAVLPHLTDDGVALPVRRDGEGSLAAAPSSPHPTFGEIKAAIRTGLDDGLNGCACESHICSAADGVQALFGGAS